MFSDAAEFINSAQTTVSEDQGTCFKLPFTTILKSI
jgi:hypothetical protein